jgi:hypothetical protein
LYGEAKMSNISKLFKWTRKIDIKDGDKILDTVYMRLVGDADYQEARGMALRYSRDLRIKMRKIDSEEYKSNFSDIDSLTKDELGMGITIGELSDYRDEALMHIVEKDPPELPDNPTLEQQEEHEVKLTEIRNKRIKDIADFIDKKAEEKKVELDKIEDTAKLKELYVHSVINVKCTEEFTRVFREYQVYKGTHKDSGLKDLAFDSFEEFNDSAPQLKSQLLNAYITLELTGEELKN